MTIKGAEADLPVRLRGGSDTWDQPQASTVLGSDWLQAAPAGYVLETTPGSYTLTGSSADLTPAVDPAELTDGVEQFDFVGGPNPTISGISFGTPASDRIVVVFFQCAATPSAVAIGGVSATFVANLSGSDYYGIAWAAVPSSSSGSLVLTGGGAYGLFSGAFAVYGEELPALDFAFVSGATSSNIDLAVGGVVVGAAIATGAISWTGVTEQAEYVGLTGANTSLALNYDTTYGAPATIQTSPAAITRLLSFGVMPATTPGAYTLTGSSAELIYGAVTGFTLDVTPGAYAISGQPARITLGAIAATTPGAYTLTGQSAAALLAARADAVAGAYSISGQQAATLAARVLSTAPGSLAVSGQAAQTLRAAVVQTTPGAYTLTGQSADVSRTYAIATTPGVYVITGQPVGMIYSGDEPVVPGQQVGGGFIYNMGTLMSR